MPDAPHPAPLVLVVDDEEELREEIALSLTESGLPALATGAAAQALPLLRRHPSILVVLSDIRMPEQDGFELIELLRQACTGTAAIEAVLFTGHGGPEEAARAKASSAAGFLRKPVRLAELRSTLQAAATLARQRRDAAA